MLRVDCGSRDARLFACTPLDLNFIISCMCLNTNMNRFPKIWANQSRFDLLMHWTPIQQKCSVQNQLKTNDFTYAENCVVEIYGISTTKNSRSRIKEVKYKDIRWIYSSFFTYFLRLLFPTCVIQNTRYYYFYKRHDDRLKLVYY